MITIAYITGRRECKWQWFIESLWLQLEGESEKPEVVVVDRHERTVADFPGADVVVGPKPCRWQGRYRLTKRDYFAAANARNTAICVAKGDYLVFVDDLSVLMPGWWNVAKWGRKNGYVISGTYDKVINLVVTGGKAVSYRRAPNGGDSRRGLLPSVIETRIRGGWIFGCSVGAPMAAWLQINGFDEDADSISGEDSLAGIMLEQNGWEIHFHCGMATLESEEEHFVEEPLLRIIKKTNGNWSEKDISHTILNFIKSGNRKRAPNWHHLECLRERWQAGGGFPTDVGPVCDWADGQRLEDM